MDLYLKIDQDENFEFFEKYDALSPLRQKIWRKIADLARKWAVCKPSQSKIAKWCECSRSAVSEAFKLFKEWGWLSLLSRGWKKSKTLLIPHSKRQMDIINRQYFKRVEATYRATHTYSIYKNNTSIDSEAVKKSFNKLEPSHLGHKLGFSIDGSLKLSLFSESIQQEALRKAKFLGKSGWRPDSDEKYFIGMMVKIAENQGQKIDWRSYYQAKKAR